MTAAIDGRGLKKAADAAVASGVRRFVLVSVSMDALPEQPRSEGLEHYMKVKRAADIHLAGTDLDFLIVRPGDLLDDAETGRVDAGVSIPYGAVPRDDVAAFIATSLFRPPPQPHRRRAHRWRHAHRQGSGRAGTRPLRP